MKYLVFGHNGTVEWTNDKRLVAQFLSQVGTEGEITGRVRNGAVYEFPSMKEITKADIKLS